MKKLLLSIIVFLISVVVYGQTPSDIAPSTYNTQLLPNNPDVASLGKFGNIPINQYNGTANISVPIHTIDFEGLSIPVGVNYNTSGIRVEQEASWVGLGWNLNAGYSITREIQGFDDLSSAEAGTARSKGWIYTDTYIAFSSLYSYKGNPFVIEPGNFVDISKSYQDAVPIDTEPDMFTISLPNATIHFYLPKISGAETTLIGKVINEKNYKVVYNIVNKTFNITDASGFNYIFNQHERSTNYGSWDAPEASTEHYALHGLSNWSTSQSLKVILNWKLSKIISPFGRELTFTYEDGLHCSFPRYSQNSGVKINNNGAYGNSNVLNTSQGKVSANVTMFHNKYLKSIEGDFGSLIFNSGTRLDLSTKESISNLRVSHLWSPDTGGQTSNSRKLDQIILKDLNGNKVKEANFEYSYFNQDELNNSSIAVKEAYIRLKLDKIIINNQKYEFEYIQPDDLPVKDSKSSDFWGFYNGIDNTMRIPTSNRFYLTGQGSTPTIPMRWKFLKAKGANKKSDILFGKIGLLNKIIYPTKGSTEFIYEANTTRIKKPYYTPTFNSAGHITSTSLNSSESYNFKYQYLKLANAPSYSFYNSTYFTETCEVLKYKATSGENFEIKDATFCDGQSYDVEIEITLKCQTGCGNTGNPSGRAVWLENLDTGQVEDLAFYNHYNFNSSIPITISLNRSLSPNRYRLSSTGWFSNGKVITAHVNATYYENNESVNQIPVVYEEFEVGGARVKKMIQRDFNERFLTASIFDYNKNFDGNTMSSGILMDDLVYTSAGQNNYEYTPEVFGNNPTNQTGCFINSNNMIRSSNAASGSHIGYSQVTQRNSNELDESLGETVSTFSNESNNYLTRNIGTSYVFNSSHNSSPAIGTFQYYEMIYSGTWYLYWSGPSISYGKTYIIGGVVFDNAYKNGKLLTSKSFDIDKNLVYESENKYQLQKLEMPFIYYPKTPFFNRNVSNVFHPFEIIYANQLNKNALYRPLQMNIKQYLNGREITKTTDYFYESNLYLMPTKVITLSSKSGRKIMQKTRYPQDIITEPYMSNLIAENRVSLPIQSETYELNGVNENLLSTRKKVYGNFNGLIQPNKIQSLKGVPSTSNVLEDRMIYHSYNNIGNPTEVSKKDGTHIVYIWGYLKTQPVAKIEGVPLSAIPQSLIANIEEASNLDTDRTLDLVNSNGTITRTGKEGQLRGALNSLRNHSSLANAQMTSFTYDPLIGVTSITDPRGETIYYEYDEFNRLKHVKDKDGNILSKNEYNYKN